MRLFLWASLLLGSVLSVCPISAEAQHFRRPFRGCCETCEMPQASCTCSQTRQVVQTQLRAQQVTTYRDVAETHVRNETVVQNVPVTTYKQVTVDEGGYQMVWVSKPVTKQVAQTVIQQQATTRQVPYQVVRKVPQISTQLVPVQTVQHVTEHVPMTTWAPAPITFQAASSCNTCDGSFSTAFAPQFIPQYNTAIAPTIQYAPATANVPTMPAISVPLPQTALGPQPIPAPTPTPAAPPANSTEQWQTIPTRQSPTTSQYDSPSSRMVPVPNDEARGTVPRTGRFVAPNSTSTAWISRTNALH